MQEIREALDQCLVHALHIRNLSPSYVGDVRQTYGKFLSETGVRSLPECTSFRIEQWLLDGRVRKDWSAATFRKRHKDIWFLFRYLKAKGIVETDPTRQIDRPKLPQRLPKGIAAEQAEKLIETTRRTRYAFAFESVRNTALVALMLFTGLRRAEVASLRLADVDLGDLGDPARHGFGNVGGMVVRVVQGKWKKDRVVPVSTRLAAILGEYLRARSRDGMECPYFFVSARGDVPMTWNSVRQVFRRLELAVGFRVTPHMLRHTFATLMLEGGCDLHTLMKLMGHTEIKTTSIYLESSIRLMASSIERHPLN